MRWINIEGLNHISLIEEIGKQFDLHPLILEDILNTANQPKIETYGNYIFTLLKSLRWNKGEEYVESKQISLILGENYLISFQEAGQSAFAPIVERLKTSKGKIRSLGPDYLFYSLTDIVVDSYFILMDSISDDLDLIEEELISKPTPATSHVIHKYKREIVSIRRSVWPLREVINRLQREDTAALFSKETRIYLRDIYDHVIQINDSFEMYREILSQMIESFLESINYKINEIMKFLTIISTIFIPLSFIASLYGMNFRNMPEVYSPWGYPIVITIMITIVTSMLFYFHKKGWI